MMSAQVTMAEPMVLVPQSVWQEMEQFRQQTTEQLALLTSLAVTGGSEWLTSEQAMAFLKVGRTKLWEIKGELERSSVGCRPRYTVASCRSYLLCRGYTHDEVNRRFNALLNTMQKK